MHVYINDSPKKKLASEPPVVRVMAYIVSLFTVNARRRRLTKTKFTFRECGEGRRKKRHRPVATCDLRHVTCVTYFAFASVLSESLNDRSGT